MDIEGNAAVEHLERAQALDALARGLPAVGGHAEERLNIRGTVKVDRLLDMAGIDISKFILRLAAKREKRVEFAVASSYHLPVADASIDLLLNCFSPLALDEFRRVLRPGGAFLYVVPSAMHLWEIKKVR